MEAPIEAAVDASAPSTAEPEMPIPTPDEKLTQETKESEQEFDVVVKNGESSTNVRVHVVNEPDTSLPYQGGYKNIATGVEYHHASIQTAPLPNGNQTVMQKFHRDAQTAEVATRSNQTADDAATQMERKDLLLETKHDYEIYSGSYQTAAELQELKEQNAVKLQCFIRQCFAWRKFNRVRLQFEQQQSAAAELQEARSKEIERRLQENMNRRNNPSKPEDFALLRDEVIAWHAEEVHRIRALDVSEEESQRQLAEALLKEVRLMQSIDRLKIEAALRREDESSRRVICQMAAPKRWSTKRNTDLAVETPLTTKAKEFAEVYHGLCLPHLERKERLDVLFNVQWIVKDVDCELAREILSLVARELDMINRARPAKFLVGLRKRLSAAFLQFSKLPECNPESVDYMLPHELNAIRSLSGSRCSTQVSNRPASNLASAQ